MAIPLIGPDGREYEIADPAKVQQAIALGYRQVTDAAPATLGEQALGAANESVDVLGAGVQGVAQGFTAGGLGAFLGAPELPGESPEDVRLRKYDASEMVRRKEAHPFVAGVGELGGMLASPVGEIGSAVSKGIGATTALGRIGAGIAAGSTEGALFGAGNTLSDAALGNQDLTAEKMIAGVGLGGLLGAAGGGVGTGLAEGFKAVAPKLRQASGARDFFADMAEGRWLKAGGATKGLIKEIPEAERSAVADAIRQGMTKEGGILPDSLEEAAGAVATERDAVAKQLLKEAGVGDAGGLTSKMDQEEAKAALQRAFKENGEKISGVYDAAHQQGAAPAFSPILKRFDDLEAGLNPAQKDLIGGDLAKARKYILEMGQAPAGSPKNSFKALNDLKATLADDINYIGDSGAKNSLKKKLVGIIRDEVDTQIGPQMGADLTKQLMDSKRAYGSLKEAARALRGKNSTGADAIRSLVKGGELAQPSLAGKLSALDHATKLIRNGIDTNAGNRVISPSDYMTGIGASMLHGGPLGALTGVASAVAHKVMREKGPAVIAKLADTISRSPQLGIAAEGLAQKMEMLAPQLGKYATPISQAFARSPSEGLATHMAWAQADPDYAQAAQLAGLLPETPEETQAAMGKANQFAAMAHQLDAQNTEITSGLKTVFKGEKSHTPRVMSSQDFGAKRMRREGVDAHNHRVTEIRNLASNPDALLERFTANIGDMSEKAPAVAASMAKTANLAVSFLAQECQEPPKAGPLAPSWVATDEEMHKFASVLEVVEEPLLILKHAAAGTLVPEQMRAVKAVYPLLARQIEDQAMEMLADPPKDVPYSSRLMLSMITGIDVDGTMSAAAISANQDAIGAKSSKPSNAGQKDSSVTLGSRTATPDQQREMGETANA